MNGVSPPGGSPVRPCCYLACSLRAPVRGRTMPTGVYRLCTGIGATGACLAGRPRLTMSCELELLSGCPFDSPGCAASANP
jgi:hypothetical protein